MDKPTGNGILEDFRIDFQDCWQRLPNKTLFLVLLTAWLALFQFLGNSTFGFVPTPSLLQWMYSVFQPASEAGAAAGDEGHGLIVPFLVVGLFWWKRKELLALPLTAWWPGLLLLGLGLGLHILGFVAQQPRISIIGMFTGIYGLMGLAWGWAWLRMTFFPFFLFVFCVPLGTLSLAITFPLQMLVCKLVELVCHNLLAIDIIRTGTQLVDPTGHYNYEVAAACSGMRSLVAIFLMATVYSFLCFRTWWKRVLLMSTALPFSVLGNLLRMLMIVVAAEMGGQKAGNYVHDSSVISLVPYVPAMVGLFYLGQLLERGEVTKPVPLSAVTVVPQPPSPDTSAINPERAPV
jgi:exosortase